MSPSFADEETPPGQLESIGARIWTHVCPTSEDPLFLLSIQPPKNSKKRAGQLSPALEWLRQPGVWKYKLSLTPVGIPQESGEAKCISLTPQSFP